MTCSTQNGGRLQGHAPKALRDFDKASLIHGMRHHFSRVSKGLNFEKVKRTNMFRLTALTTLLSEQHSLADHA